MSFGPLLAAAPGGTAQRGSDPLSGDERTRSLAAVVLELSANEPVMAAALERQGAGHPETASTPAREGLEAAELLMVERAWPTKGERSQRRAHVYLYDYRAQLLRRFTVDAASGAVVEHQAAPGTQLPLNESEARSAFAAALGDAAIRRQVREQHQALLGEPLLNSSQLRPHLFVFVAAGRPEGLGEEAARCGARRCAQVLFTAARGVTLPLSVVVDLELARVVARWNVDGEAGHGH